MIWGTIVLFLVTNAGAHPTGNMITIGEHVLWSYIHPIDDPNHFACVMIWTKGAQPEVFFQSEYPASDVMLYSSQNEFYIVERRYVQVSDEFQIRVLKSSLDAQPFVIWDWINDAYRIGEGGFIMLSDEHMVFGRYPEVYSLIKGEQPTRYFEFDYAVKRIRAVEHDRILLLGDHSCYLVRQDGSLLKQWKDLVDHGVENAPMGLNQVFDMDYSDGELLLSYWGRRSFDLICGSRERSILLQQSEPFAPHWVAFRNKEKLLFSSSFIFDGSTPKPYLVLLNEENHQTVIWSDQ